MISSFVVFAEFVSDPFLPSEDPRSVVVGPVLFYFKSLKGVGVGNNVLFVDDIGDVG
jgi:hypothetical protein